MGQTMILCKTTYKQYYTHHFTNYNNKTLCIIMSFSLQLLAIKRPQIKHFESLNALLTSNF